MADQSALKHAFAEYARTIAHRYEIGEVLYRLTDQVVEVLDIGGAGVCLGDADGDLQFVTATDQPISHVEWAQVETQQGPCHEAFHSRAPVTVSDLAAEDRWPGFTSVALEVGMHAVAGIPMVVDDRRVGALNLYSHTPREWPADDIADAQLLADMATGYIVNAQTLTESERLTRQLQHALDSRVVIEQAKGVIAERHGIPTATAFNLLRGHARSTNTKIHDVARAVVERRLNF